VLELIKQVDEEIKEWNEFRDICFEILKEKK
jgi:hypothetical protein